MLLKAMNFSLHNDNWWKMVFSLSSGNKTTEQGTTSHNIAQEKEAIKMPLVHKTMGTLLWGAKEYILV